MCCPFRQMFKAVRDFHRTISEVKSNLSDIKGIVNSTSKITQSFENVTGEIKKVVEFYAEESKAILRTQLYTAMSDAGQEELCHQEFLNFIKSKFERDICELIEKYTSLNARVAILTIINSLIKLITLLQAEISQEDCLKIKMLTNLELYFNDSYNMYKRNDALKSDKSNNSENIKLFCDQQNIISEFEEAIKSHLSNTKNQPYPSFKDFQELKFRARETKIRKLKKYLSDKIKVKNVGKMYKEEISLHIDIDLKKAEHKVNEVQCFVNNYCTKMTSVLQQIPKERFAEFLEQERVINISNLIKNIIFAEDFTCVRTKDQLNKSFKTKNEEQTISLKSRSSQIEPLMSLKSYVKLSQSNSSDVNSIEVEGAKLSDNLVTITVSSKQLENENFCSELDRNKIYQLLKKKLLQFDDNNDLKRILEIGKVLVTRTDFYKVFQQNIANGCQVDKTNNTNEVSSNNLYQSTILKNTIIIDPQLILDDLEIVTKPFLNHIQESSLKYAMECLENSHVVASSVIDFLGFIEGVIQESEINLESNENILLEKVFEILDCSFEEENARLLKSILYALLSTKRSRQRFLKKLQEIVIKMLFTSATSLEKPINN